ncbi:B12-binding domain-containing radical SAM protein [Desulfosporosinus youngiae]|uniref:Radical SAM core domain-containing protein n=1 Tax=Desulfosporosinus youngiae DSM 17734 TaxID=768710 RepID=H5Y3D4_9FIRM|nr:radical SAM protein [Desulfosporosinus youngiae]EHQ88903.1 hypothetical protein DesyoDRAFT_1775 [Desulfosporosinus youngiae DSM 17734]
MSAAISEQKKKKKILLSSVCAPFGVKYGDGFGVSYEGSWQVLWAQGVFRPRATTTQWGIDFIAENLDAPVVTLHYPTLKKFIAELKNNYDYVGIAFVPSTLHKLIPMVKAIRSHAPDTKIILGGYGTVLDDSIIGPYYDHICRNEEGVAFMRRLLGEENRRSFRQPDITQRQTLFSIPVTGRLAYIFAGLGCPNGCDFCTTSHYFKQKHLALIPTGKQIVETISEIRIRHPDITSFFIQDEDFLLNEKRGRGFLAAIRDSRLPPLSISTYGSVKALSQYTPAELVEMGIDWLWIGYEGKSANYEKMRGKSYQELFSELRAHGIGVLASMILGFDYQNQEIIRQEFAELMDLKPCACQFLIYAPTWGTPLRERLNNEGRMLPMPVEEFSKADAFMLAFKHPHLGQDEMSGIQKELYREEFRRMGPTAFRVIENWLIGYKNLKDHPLPRVRAKAEQYGKDAHRAMILLAGSKGFVNEKTAQWLQQLIAEIAEATGPQSWWEKMASYLIPGMIRFTQFKTRLNIQEQPEFTRRRFRC